MIFLKLKTGKISRLIFLTLLFLLFAKTNQVLADIEVSGSIISDTVWSATNQPYVVTGTLYICNNATLTIAQGVKVYLNSDSQIRIGNNSTGKLVAEGTQKKPITFTGSPEAPWYYLFFGTDTEEGSILSHCVIENGGNSGCGMVRVYTDNLTVEYCTIKNSASSGLYLDSDGVPTLRENSYKNNANYPIHAGSAESLSAIDHASSYAGNNDNRIYIHDHYLTRGATLTDAGTPYLFSGGFIRLYNDATLTIQSGTELQFESNKYLYVGNACNLIGTLIAEGTADTSITLTSAQAAPEISDWDEIYSAQFNGDNSLLNAVILYGLENFQVVGSNSIIEKYAFQNALDTGLNITNSTLSIFFDTVTEKRVVGNYTESADFAFYDNDIFTNTDYGLQFNTSNTPETPEDKWWNATGEPENDEAYARQTRYGRRGMFPSSGFKKFIPNILPFIKKSQ